MLRATSLQKIVIHGVAVDAYKQKRNQILKQVQDDIPF